MVDSLIRLYPSNEHRFVDNGLGTLAETLEATVIEEKNGVYELEMFYPMTGRHFSDLELGRIITCKVNPFDDTFQPFRIYSISKPIDGHVQIDARHISYDLLGHVVLPFNIRFVDGVIYINDQPTEYEEIIDAVVHHLTELDAQALQIDPDEWSEKQPFTFSFGVRSGDQMISANAFASQEPAALRTIMGEGDESLLGVFGGELEYDRYSVKLWSHRGVDNGVSIRYGKNMVDLQRSGSAETCYTGVFPYYRYSSNGVTTVKIIDDGGNPVIPIEREDFYDEDFFDVNVNVLPLDLSGNDIKAIDPDAEEPTAEILRAFADLYIEANQLGQPTYDIIVSYQPISDSAEYKAYRALESIRLCDWVTVEHEQLGVRNLAEVVKIEYDVLRDRYGVIELTVNGEPKSLDRTIVENKTNTNKVINKTKDTDKNVTDIIDQFDVVRDDVDVIQGNVTEMNEELENLGEEVQTASEKADAASEIAADAIVRQRTLYSNYSRSDIPTLPDGYVLLDSVTSDGSHSVSSGIAASLDVDLVVETTDGFTSNDPDITYPTLFGYSNDGNYFSLNRNITTPASSNFNVDGSINQKWNYSSHSGYTPKTFELNGGTLTVKSYDTDDQEVTDTYEASNVSSFSEGGIISIGGNTDATRQGKQRYCVATFKRVYTRDGSHNLYPARVDGSSQCGLFDISTNAFRTGVNWEPGEDVTNVPPVPTGTDIPWEIPVEYQQYWSVAIPAPLANHKYYICTETQYGDGHVTYTPAMEDKNDSLLLTWCDNTNSVQINGGMIAANTIAADRIIANSLSTMALKSNVLASQEYIDSEGVRGMGFDLTRGVITANGGVFRVDESGNITALSGVIGAFVIDNYGNLRATSQNDDTEISMETTSNDDDLTSRIYVGTRSYSGSEFLETHPLNCVQIKNGSVIVMNEVDTASSKRINVTTIRSEDVTRGYYEYSQEYYETVGNWRWRVAVNDATFGWHAMTSLETRLQYIEDRINDFEDRISALES